MLPTDDSSAIIVKSRIGVHAHNADTIRNSPEQIEAPFFCTKPLQFGVAWRC